MKIFLVIFSLIFFIGCSSANRLTSIDLDKKTADIKYGVKESEKGFEIEIEYAKYQFFPESTALITACKSQLVATAYDYADEKEREIKNINEQRIKISTGRNGLTGVTSCTASTKVKWKD